MGKEYGGFQDLRTWQKARELMTFVHQQVVPLLPVDEKWDLAHQIRKSSKSVMANIAEGYGRYYYQETVRFCYIARGSLDETHNHLITASDLDYIPRSMYVTGENLIQELSRLLNGYIAYLKRTRCGGDLPGGRLKEIEGGYRTNGTTFTDSISDPKSPVPDHCSLLPAH